MRPSPFPFVPEETAAIVRAAFRKGKRCLLLRDELGALYADADFAALFPARGCRALPPWHLVLVTVLQFLEGLSAGRRPTRCLPLLRKVKHPSGIGSSR
jgi:transposase